MNNDKNIFITINHFENFMPVMSLKVGDVLTLKKEPDNQYDDEAIAVYTESNYKCGYVANSVSTVARGTYSAGRVCEQINDGVKCRVRFIFVDSGVIIAEVNR